MCLCSSSVLMQQQQHILLHLGFIGFCGNKLFRSVVLENCFEHSDSSGADNENHQWLPTCSSSGRQSTSTRLAVEACLKTAPHKKDVHTSTHTMPQEPRLPLQVLVYLQPLSAAFAAAYPS